MTYLAVRRGFHIIPKYILGKPLDQLPAPPFMPFALQLRLLDMLLRVQTGKMSVYGLPEPDHRLGQAHPTVSSDILMRITHGRVKVKPRSEERRVGKEGT